LRLNEVEVIERPLDLFELLLPLLRAESPLLAIVALRLYEESLGEPLFFFLYLGIALEEPI
jgi:hypothetical protein